MKRVFQFGIILAVTLFSELLSLLIPLPIPASVYGLVIMVICLKTKLIPLSAVKPVGEILLTIMPIMFIPACVGLMTKADLLSAVWLPLGLTVTLGTVIVLIATGKTAQWIIRMERKRDHE